MQYYVGLDVSQRQTAICIVDGTGKKVAEGKALSLPSDIHNWLTTKIADSSTIVRVGIESGAMTRWLCAELTKLGLPMICLEAYQAHQFVNDHRLKAGGFRLRLKAGFGRP